MSAYALDSATRRQPIKSLETEKGKNIGPGIYSFSKRWVGQFPSGATRLAGRL
jgi:hypothetical protein